MNTQALLNDLKMLRSIEQKYQDAGTKQSDYLLGFKDGVINTYDLLITLVEKSDGIKNGLYKFKDKEEHC